MYIFHVPAFVHTVRMPAQKQTMYKSRFACGILAYVRETNPQVYVIL